MRNWYGRYQYGGMVVWVELAHERALFCELVLFRSITSDDPYTEIYQMYMWKGDFVRIIFVIKTETGPQRVTRPQKHIFHNNLAHGSINAIRAALPIFSVCWAMKRLFDPRKFLSEEGG